MERYAHETHRQLRTSPDHRRGDTGGSIPGHSQASPVCRGELVSAYIDCIRLSVFLGKNRKRCFRFIEKTPILLAGYARFELRLGHLESRKTLFLCHQSYGRTGRHWCPHSARQFSLQTTWSVTIRSSWSEHAVEQSHSGSTRFEMGQKVLCHIACSVAPTIYASTFL